MKNLRTTKALVKLVLEEVPATRNSDNLLFLEVVKRINKSLIYKPMSEVLMDLKEYDLPSIETVGRCRRKLQAEFPELSANKKVEASRAENEAEFRAWSVE